jgi:hypothetical protein
MTLRTSLAATTLAGGLLLAASACGRRHDATPLEPMGRLPGLVTTAEPEWIPFQVSAGATLPSDPREPRLSDARAVPVGGQARKVAWSPDGRALLVEVKRDGAACEEAWEIPLDRQSPRRVSGAGSRGRIGAYVAPGKALVAESACNEANATAAWQLVEVDVASNTRRVVARPEGEVLGASIDAGFAFFATHVAGKKDRVERVALVGGASTLLADCASLDPTMAVARASVVYACRERDGTTQLVTTSDEGAPSKPWSGGASFDVDAALSSDARMIVFASSRAASRNAKKSDGPFQIYVANASVRDMNAEVPPERVTFAGSSNRGPALGPSGRIAFLSDRGAPGGPLGVVVARFDAP